MQIDTIGSGGSNVVLNWDIEDKPLKSENWELNKECKDRKVWYIIFDYEPQWERESSWSVCY